MSLSVKRREKPLRAKGRMGETQTYQIFDLGKKRVASLERGFDRGSIGSAVNRQIELRGVGG